jgi:hypothetical protein
MTEGRVEERTGGVPAGDALYGTFLWNLSGDGIARFAVVPALDGSAPEDQQVAHLLRHSRVAECNERFASLYGRPLPAMAGSTMGELVPADDPARMQGIREFVRAGFRLSHSEEEHVQPGAASRWLNATAQGALRDGRLHEFWLCLRDVSARKRSELDRERRGRILEALAFLSARLLQPGSWRDQIDEVLARLGEAAQAARAWIGEQRPDAGRFHFLKAWGMPGVEIDPLGTRILGAMPIEESGLENVIAELEAGRPVVTLVRELPDGVRRIPERMGSKSFAVVRATSANGPRPRSRP